MRKQQNGLFNFSKKVTFRAILAKKPNFCNIDSHLGQTNPLNLSEAIKTLSNSRFLRYLQFDKVYENSKGASSRGIKYFSGILTNESYLDHLQSIGRVLGFLNTVLPPNSQHSIFKDIYLKRLL